MTTKAKPGSLSLSENQAKVLRWAGRGFGVDRMYQYLPRVGQTLDVMVERGLVTVEGDRVILTELGNQAIARQATTLRRLKPWR